MLGGPWLLQREWVHEPADHDRGRDKACEQPEAEAKLVARCVAGKRRKHDRHKKRKHDHETEMRRHLRPSAMSYASMTTSMFNSPATIMNVLPYSYDAAVTTPCPNPIALATK